MSLAREIYGRTPWAIDPFSFREFQNTLLDFRNGITYNKKGEKNNSFSVYDIVNNDFNLIEDTRQLNTSKEFSGIGVINLNGAITRSGGSSTTGTEELSQMMLSMAKDNRIKGFIINVDSGGGSSAAVDILANAISEIKQTKPVYSLIKDNGMAASAAYGIISGSTKIFAEDKKSIVGSIGTMMQIEGYANGTVEPNGLKHITIYATKSTEKNKAYNEALNNDNYELIINDILNPENEDFISLVSKNRPQLKGTNFDDGHTVRTGDAVGTFIDGFATFNDIVNMILTDTNYNSNTNTNINNNSKIMTKQELQSSFPDVYNSILNEGIKQESERVKSWLTYLAVDSEAVVNGINSDSEITASSREQFLFKMSSQAQLTNLQNDSAPAVQTEQTPVVAPVVAAAQNANDEQTKQAHSFFANVFKQK